MEPVQQLSCLIGRATPVTTIPLSLANRMLSLLICVANDAVIKLSLPHFICWEHGVEGKQAVTTKDRARGGVRTLQFADPRLLKL